MPVVELTPVLLVELHTRTETLDVVAPFTALVMLSVTTVATAEVEGVEDVLLTVPPWTEYCTPARGAAARVKTMNQK